MQENLTQMGVGLCGHANYVVVQRDHIKWVVWTQCSGKINVYIYEISFERRNPEMDDGTILLRGFIVREIGTQHD